MSVSEPVSLGPRGSELWRGLSDGVTDVGRLALVTEAARLADRLDELDNIIQGKGVLNLMQFRVLDNAISESSQEINIEVKFAAPLAEARQQTLALVGVLRALGPTDSAVSKSSDGPVATPLDGLMKKIAERQAKSS
ncbi:hypothetical protein D9M72_548750 [compost metagenome]